MSRRPAPIQTRRVGALPDRLDDVTRWVADELDGLFTGDARRSGAFVGGQTAADQALAALDISGYARRRNQVHPASARGASKMSPYIRYGLVDLVTLHDHALVAGAPSNDRFKYRSELLWQEYARHWYAVFGTQTRDGVYYRPQDANGAWTAPAWPDEMQCVQATVDELHTDGWMVNQSRMWLASQWTVRAGARWQEGEDAMFRHLLDGSRAANRLGWQWVVGASRNRTYGFARRQVLRRAREFCETCELRDNCPIVSYPRPEPPAMTEPVPVMSADLLLPPARGGRSPAGAPEAVWLTAESLGDADPALTAHPDRPVHFVFDEPLLTRLRLDGKRLVFIAETLADLARRRDLTVWRGRPADLLSGQLGLGGVAVTGAPVPGLHRLVGGAAIDVHVEPWLWLRPATTALIDRLTKKRFPDFGTWVRLTSPVP